MNYRLRKLATAAMLAALAYAAVALIRIPMVLFLSYEPKDVILTVAGFLLGPLSAVGMSALVALLEMVTFSTTGIIGCIMNLVSSCAFILPPALIYRRNKTLASAVIGLIAGTLTMTAVMLLWNYGLTPLYMDTPREVIKGMLLPVFLPFNLIKAALNAGITMLLYRPLVVGLRRARLLPPSPVPGNRSRTVGVSLAAAAFTLTLVMVILAWKGII